MITKKTVLLKKVNFSPYYRFSLSLFLTNQTDFNSKELKHVWVNKTGFSNKNRFDT